MYTIENVLGVCFTQCECPLHPIRYPLRYPIFILLRINLRLYQESWGRESAVILFKFYSVTLTISITSSSGFKTPVAMPVVRILKVSGSYIIWYSIKVTVCCDYILFKRCDVVQFANNCHYNDVLYYLLSLHSLCAIFDDRGWSCNGLELYIVRAK